MAAPGSHGVLSVDPEITGAITNRSGLASRLGQWHSLLSYQSQLVGEHGFPRATGLSAHDNMDIFGLEPGGCNI